MGRTCTICKHPERGIIEDALLAGTPFRNIAKRSGISITALHRHKHDHMPESLAKAEAAEQVRADDLLEQVRHLQEKALSILATAEQAGDMRTALQAIREARGNLELLAKMLGELQQEGTVNITMAPEWLELRAVIVQALRPHPEALEAVTGALGEAER